MDNTAAVADSTQPTQKSNRSALLIVFVVVFIDLLGFAIVLPLLPIIADTYIVGIVPQGEQGKFYEGMVLGLLMASFSLMQFIFAPIWGRVSDRVGRRPILLLGLAGSVAFYSLLGYACTLSGAQAALAVTLLFLARIGAGISGATIGTAQAVIADSTPPEKRKHGMALIGMAFGIGFTFGPIFGYFALLWFPQQLEAVGYTAAALSLASFLAGFFLLPETRRWSKPAAAMDAATGKPIESSHSPAGRRGWNLGAMFRAVTDPAIGAIILVFFLSTLGFASFETTLALFLDEVPVLKSAAEINQEKAMQSERRLVHAPDRHTLLIFAYVGFTLALTQGFYRGLAKRMSELTFITIGIGLMAVGVGSLSIVCYGGYQELQGNPTSIPLMPLMLVALTAAVVGYAFMTPSAQALISRRTSAQRQGEILGINQSAASLSRILGPMIGIPLFKSTPDHMMPYILGAALVLLMVPFLPRIRRGDAAAGAAPNAG